MPRLLEQSHDTATGEPAEPSHASFGSHLASFGKAALGEARRNTQIAVHKAMVEKLKLIDLNKAHYALGKRAVELCLFQKEFGPQWRAIADLERRVKEKRV